MVIKTMLLLYHVYVPGNFSVHIFSMHLTMLECATAKGYSVCRSVRPSVTLMIQIGL